MPVLKHEATWEYCYVSPFVVWFFKFLCLPTLNWNIVNITFYVNWQRKLSKIQPGWNNSKLNFFAAFFFQFTQSQRCFQMSGFLASRIGHTGYCKRCRTRCWYVTCERYMIFIILSSPAIWNFKLFNHEVNGVLLNITFFY